MKHNPNKNLAEDPPKKAAAFLQLRFKGFNPKTARWILTKGKQSLEYYLGVSQLKVDVYNNWVKNVSEEGI
jgi:hypothetical protein